MFSLIIVLISIVLVAALAIAGAYYGSEVWGDGESQARAATIVNQGEQIVAAAKLYAIHYGRPVQQLHELVSSGYLSTVPVPPTRPVASASLSPISAAYATEATWGWDAETETLSLTRQVGEDVCAEVNSLSFSHKTVRNLVDTRLRLQCYGDAAPYTVLWDARANIPEAAPAVHPLCVATEHIKHIPERCGSDLLENADLTTPVQLILASYPNALGPVDLIPDLDGTYWENRNGKTCSKPQDYGIAIPSIQFVVVSPANSSTRLMFDERREFITEDFNSRYKYHRSYTTRVYIDDVLQQEFQAYDENALVGQEVSNIVLAPGAHIVRLEFTASMKVGTDSYGVPYSPESLPATPPLTDICISNLQIPMQVIPTVAQPESLPPAGEIRFDNVNCKVSQFPTKAGVDYGSFWNNDWWVLGGTSYRITVSSMTIVGTPETLDNFWGTWIGAQARAGSVFPQRAEIFFNGWVSLSQNLVRTSPTTLTLVGPIAKPDWLAVSAQPCEGGATIGECLATVLQEVVSPAAKQFDLELFASDITSNVVECASQAERSEIPLVHVTGYKDYLVIQDYYMDALTREPSLATTSLSCDPGFSWDTSREQCVCQPTATSVCASPNSGLPSGVTNTNSNVTCTGVSGTMTAGKCFPWAPAG